MTTEQYQIGYEEGYQAGWNAAMDAKPASKPLTDEQIEQCMKQAYATVQGRNLEHAFARAIEAKLREKNA